MTRPCGLWRKRPKKSGGLRPTLAAWLTMPQAPRAPMQRGLVVRLDKEGRREPAIMRWGLVPSWSNDDKAGAAMINAKAETVAERPAYRAASKARPCLVVADGIYEWAKVGPKEKQPYFITTKGRSASGGSQSACRYICCRAHRATVCAGRKRVSKIIPCCLAENWPWRKMLSK